MNHPLYVGYFDKTDSSRRFKLRRPLDINVIDKVVSETCQSENGTISQRIDRNATHMHYVCRIGNEDLYFKNGYLVCPWLGMGINKESLELICRMFHEFGCSIYNPEEGVFYTPNELAKMEKEFYQVGS